MADKFKYDSVNLQEFAAIVQADEANITVDDWNALSKTERAAHLKAWNAAEKKLMREAWEDAEMEDQPEKPGRKKKGDDDEPKQPGAAKWKAPGPPSLRSGSLKTSGLETRRLMKEQIGSGGRYLESPGFAYLRENSPFAVEQRAQRPVKNEPAKKPAKKAKRNAPGVDEAIANTNRKLKAAGYRAIGDPKGF